MMMRTRLITELRAVEGAVQAMARAMTIAMVRRTWRLVRMEPHKEENER
jgi:hypothetical protein